MHYHLAPINIAKFLRPMSDPVNADFVSNLEQVNRVAEYGAVVDPRWISTNYSAREAAA